MADWQRRLAAMVHQAELYFDRFKYGLRRRLPNRGPVIILPYRGYGSASQLYLRGRVLRDKGITAAGANDGLWHNLRNMYRRLESDEIPFARVQARFQEQSLEFQADEEGYFEVWLPGGQSAGGATLWQPVELTLIEPTPAGAKPVQATGEVLVPATNVRFGVISDIDDTVVRTDVTQLLRMARNVFLSNARTRLPFAGVAAFYRALQAGGQGDEGNPLFYVSSSPWNFYDLLAEFFQLQGIPSGPIFLRDWGISPTELLPTQHRGHKLAIIEQMLAFYHDLPFILIGDSGQEDPEIYSEVVHNHPDRILAVYIRNVSRDQARPQAVRALAEEVIQAGSTLILADDTEALARHAIEQGWLAAGSLPAILDEKALDEAPPSPLAAITGTPADEETTIIVSGKQSL
jgi:phosphatidate phosphatase APP1